MTKAVSNRDFLKQCYDGDPAGTSHKFLRRMAQFAPPLPQYN